MTQKSANKLNHPPATGWLCDDSIIAEQKVERSPSDDVEVPINANTKNVNDSATQNAVKDSVATSSVIIDDESAEEPQNEKPSNDEILPDDAKNESLIPQNAESSGESESKSDEMLEDASTEVDTKTPDQNNSDSDLESALESTISSLEGVQSDTSGESLSTEDNRSEMDIRDSQPISSWYENELKNRAKAEQASAQLEKAESEKPVEDRYERVSDEAIKKPTSSLSNEETQPIPIESVAKPHVDTDKLWKVDSPEEDELIQKFLHQQSGVKVERGSVWWALAMGAIAVSTLIRFILIDIIPLGDAEAYYYSWSLHPAFSYFDHPGMVAWMINC